MLPEGISRVMKVCLVSDMDERIMEKTSLLGIFAEKAKKLIEKEDVNRRKWGLSLYGRDTRDPLLYDMMLHVDNLSVDNAVDVLAETVSLPCFRSTEESIRRVDDMALAADVYAAMVDFLPGARVTCKDGVVNINIRSNPARKARLSSEIQERLSHVSGIKSMEVDIQSYINMCEPSYGA